MKITRFAIFRQNWHVVHPGTPEQGTPEQGTPEHRNITEHSGTPKNPEKPGTPPKNLEHSQENAEHPKKTRNIPRKPGTPPRKPGTPPRKPGTPQKNRKSAKSKRIKIE